MTSTATAPAALPQGCQQRDQLHPRQVQADEGRVRAVLLDLWVIAKGAAG